MSGALDGGRRYVVTAQRRVHILDGDRTGGGHRAGSGGGKSEFPAAWSDDAIIDAIEEVANDPASARAPGRNGKIRLTGVRGGLSIAVIVDPASGSVVTGFPA
jgi:hypothetical protein